MFWSLAMKLNRKQAEIAIRAADRHNDLYFKGLGDPLVEFIWDPYLNSTNLSTELTKISSREPSAENASQASIIMIGGGL